MGPPRRSTRAAPTFADRLTDADRARSLAPAGVREGPDGLFRVVYRFENEKLVELINRTVHAAALSALVETANPRHDPGSSGCQSHSLIEFVIFRLPEGLL
jgi:hypothetical protein